MIALITLITESMIMGIVYSFTGECLSSFFVMCFILIDSLALLFGLNRSAIKSVYKPIMIGYFLRLSLMVFDIYGSDIYVLPNSGADSIMFYNNAVNYMYNGWTARGLFPKVIGTIFSFIGPSRLFAQYLILMCSIAAICFLAFIVLSFDISQNLKYRTVGIAALLPNFAILSSIFLRESIVTMLLTLSVVCFLKWMQGTRFAILILSVASALGAALFHSGAIAVLVGYFCVLLIYNRNNRVIVASARNIIIALIVAIPVAFIIINYGDAFLNKFASVDSLEDIANTSFVGGSSYAQYVGNSKSIGSMIIFTVPRMLYFMFSPFPWQWRGLSDIIAFFFSSLFYIEVVVSLIKYFKANRTDNRYLVVALCIIVAAVIFVFGWGVSNTGTAARHRDKVILVMAMIYALTHNPDNDKKYMIGRHRII